MDKEFNKRLEIKMRQKMVRKKLALDGIPKATESGKKKIEKYLKCKKIMSRYCSVEIWDN